MKVDPRFWLSAGIALVLSSLAMMLVPNGWAEAPMVVGIAFVAAIGNFVPLAAPILRVPRRYVRNQSVLPLNLAPKRQPLVRRYE